MLAIIYSFFTNIVMLVVLSIVYVIALMILIFSMFPMGNMNVDTGDGVYDEKKDNYFYWKDIAKYTKTDYVDRVYKQFFQDSGEEACGKQEIMFAEEIITNARIAKYKYKMFELAAKVVIVVTVMLPIGLIVLA